MEEKPFPSQAMENQDEQKIPQESPLLTREEFESVSGPPKKTRRKALALVALGSAAAAGIGSRTEQGKRLLASGRNLLERFEDQWHEHRSGGSFATQSIPLPNELEYVAFLEKLSLRYISPTEIIKPHRNIRNGVANEIPPRHMWDRVVDTLKVADEIRHRLGKPLYCINSAYRCPAYNAECSGAASHSYHMKNRALDLMFTGGPEAAADVARKLREEGFFSGGIGVYPSFIHVDTRGYDASWGA